MWFTSREIRACEGCTRQQKSWAMPHGQQNGGVAGRSSLFSAGGCSLAGAQDGDGITAGRLPAGKIGPSGASGSRRGGALPHKLPRRTAGVELGQRATVARREWRWRRKRWRGRSRRSSEGGLAALPGGAVALAHGLWIPESRAERPFGPARRPPLPAWGPCAGPLSDTVAGGGSGGDGNRTHEPLACHASALPTELRPQNRVPVP